LLETIFSELLVPADIAWSPMHTPFAAATAK
jgi:hypothetical protein